MKILAFLTTFALVGTISRVSSTRISPNYDFPDEKVKIFEIGCVLTLVCAVTDDVNADTESIRWYKKIDEARAFLIETNHHYELKHETLRVENPVSSDAGQYLCWSKMHDMNASITVIANVKAVLNEEYFFVEGETLNVTCVVDGTEPFVTWRIGNVSYDESTDHVVIERGPKYGRILINDVKTNDTDVYTCVVENQATKLLGIGKEAATQVHIWQQYVILWPFIGVCFEVAILCVGILFYERRCTKPEMELEDIEELEEDEEMEGDMNEYDISSNPVSVVDVRQRK